MKILVTGFSGFVGRHFLRYLEDNAIAAELLGVDRCELAFPLDGHRHVRGSYRQLDLLDKGGVEAVIDGFRPTHILHLASYSSVGFSWQQPVESFVNNTNILLNLLEQVRALRSNCRILSVGSSEEYGNVLPSAVPIREDAALKPVSPYAVARVAQEMLSSLYVSGYGLDIVMTRSFNHIGTHQRDVFVVPSLARQLTAIRHRQAPPRLVTGDRTIVRDFVDVRDVVRAYHLLLLGGKAGEIYNVCSGRGVSIDEVIDLMRAALGIQVTLATDPALLRPSDNRVIIGSNEKIHRELGWEPRISLRESLEQILEWWNARHPGAG